MTPRGGRCTRDFFARPLFEQCAHATCDDVSDEVSDAVSDEVGDDVGGDVGDEASNEVSD